MDGGLLEGVSLAIPKSDINDSFRPRSHSCPTPGSETHHRPHSVISIRTRKPGLLLWVGYTTWVDEGY
jgi:hypothetical protein